MDRLTEKMYKILVDPGMKFYLDMLLPGVRKFLKNC